MEERTRARHDERMALMMIDTIIESLEDAVKPLEVRLSVDKYAMRSLKTAITNLRRVYGAAAKTIELDSMEYIIKNSQGYELVIRQKRMTADERWTYVRVDDLQKIVNIATKDECALCLKDGGEIKQCKFRKTLLNVAIEPDTKYGCGFRAAAE